MNETADLPEQRPMPEGLRDRLWEEIEPQLEVPGNRFRTWRAPLTAAAAVILLAAGVVFALPLIRGGGPATAAAGPDMQLVNDCIHTPYAEIPSGSWRAGAKLDYDSKLSYVVIRSDEYAGVCVLTNGKPTGIMGGVSTRHTYGNLTASRPWDYLSSDNFDTESIHFGITAGNVAQVALVGPDKVAVPTTLKDGTFIVRTKFAEDSNSYTSNRVKATLDTGQVIEGPFRS
ncbi:hypothetical protein [Kutzneria sp. CA-103260]|uniref:hypothetical protein n=1 Tax=Kutzneria sp. CA-103260 TaxID=2802641 RepID=UPI001BAC86FC|nr:hypothetical protein [Kutzneria sp. CA-103260]QUQ68656.1 hypothetical protein JJ691_64030 [Kutzneria sp. CA-103260]